MNTFKTFIASAAIAASTFGLVAVSTSAQAGISTCGAWRCGYNGISLNGLQFNDIKWNGVQFNDLKWNGLQFNSLKYNNPILQGISMQGISMQGVSMQGVSMQGTAVNGAQAGDPVAVTLPSGETLLLK